MNFPLPPREAALLAEFIRVFDARLVTEGAVAERASVVMSVPTSAAPSPPVTESLFPNEERAA